MGLDRAVIKSLRSLIPVSAQSGPIGNRWPQRKHTSQKISHAARAFAARADGPLFWSSVYRAAGSGWKIAKVLPSES